VETERAAPVLSYVTGTVDRPEGLARLIASLAKHTPFPWEARVGDASESGYARNHEFPLGRVIVDRQQPRPTMVQTYDRLFRACAGAWVLWLNDDAEVMPGAPAAALRFMEANPEVGCGALYYQEGLGSVWRVNEYKGMVYANFGILPREFGDRIGWFGTELASYGCDNRISFETLLAGKGVVGIPDARVVHHVDANPRKERQSREYRPHASAWLESAYGRKLTAMRAVHDRFARLNPCGNVLER